MIHTQIFYNFLCSAHAVGWCLVAQRAMKKGMVDLCQFLRAFLFAPFALVFSMLMFLLVGRLIRFIIIPNFINFSLGVLTVVGSVVIMGGVGYFGIAPAVKKAHGIVKPFSEKICIVLYRTK